ncbi:type IV pilus biogenesis/stability protein PilW [Thiomonas intermedia]|uniref:type IV pilus biogenesis/stability protein PilW n=1 Tax=Thiomonas intermedia TaxID=926 RepID=UPI0009A53B44|nr:type IV pilus biogenesis/stability protein PilW [Thiomonas intermedia]
MFSSLRARASVSHGRMALMGFLMAGALLLGGCATQTQRAADMGSGAALTPQQSDVLKRVQLRLELAEGYYQRGQFQVALEEVNKALADKSDYVPAYTMRALIYTALNDSAKADANYREALRLAPDNPDALHNYGWFLCQQRRYPDSFAQFNKALSIQNYRYPVRSYLALGVCQYRAGDWAASEGTLKKGFALDPGNPALSTNLAVVLDRMGKAKEALFYIARVNSGTYASAQSLWVGILIARKAGNAADVALWTNQIEQRFPDSREAIAAQQGRFDDSTLLNY